MDYTPEAWKIFELANLVPYREGEVVNKYVIATEKMKLAVMSLDAKLDLPSIRLQERQSFSLSKEQRQLVMGARDITSVLERTSGLPREANAT